MPTVVVAAKYSHGRKDLRDPYIISSLATRTPFELDSTHFLLSFFLNTQPI